MKYNASAAKEQKASRLLPRGDYYFEVIGAEEKVSTAGNDMLVLKLAVYEESGKKRSVVDRIGSWNWDNYKVFCEATGLNKEDNLSSVDYIGASGRCSIKTGKDWKKEDCDAVAWYIPLRDGQAAPARPERRDVEPVAAASSDDDGLPF